jgi:hypothetical protein
MDKLLLQVQHEFGQDDLGILRHPDDTSIGIMHLKRSILSVAPYGPNWGWHLTIITMSGRFA